MTDFEAFGTMWKRLKNQHPKHLESIGIQKAYNSHIEAISFLDDDNTIWTALSSEGRGSVTIKKNGIRTNIAFSKFEEKFYAKYRQFLTISL